MKKQLLLTSAVCMISGVLWQGNVHAQKYAAYGFSEYCSVWTGLSNLPNLTGGVIEYTVTIPEFRVYCDDLQTAPIECTGYCDNPQTAPIECNDSEKQRIVISKIAPILNGLTVVHCVDLTDFITPDMCSANLQPRVSSAHFYDVEVVYTIKVGVNVLLSVNVGVGQWEGTFDNNACTPSHDDFIFAE